MEPDSSIFEIEDDDFLAQVAAAEADALSNKRRKTSTATTVSVGSRDGYKDDGDGGLYTAALRGNDSLLLLQRTAAAKGRTKPVTPAGGNDGVSVGGDSCFKCGKSGHWARDCVEAGPGGGRYNGNFERDTSVAEKPCPCGLGTCLVLTANTEKNRGRKFYKCPLREESGGCGFFEWCDSAAGTNMTGGTQSFAPNSLFPVIPCPCGAGSCLTLTARTGKNVGQQFYRCPKDQGSSCGFFKWCNEPAEGGVSATTSPYKSSYNTETGDKSKPSYGFSNGSACFKCGKEGHWAKECPTASSNSPVEGQKSTPSGTCYKCNKAGHWAKECPTAPSNSSVVGQKSTPPGTCYKCNKAGHWARDCHSSQYVNL